MNQTVALLYKNLLGNTPNLGQGHRYGTLCCIDSNLSRHEFLIFMRDKKLRYSDSIYDALFMTIKEPIPIKIMGSRVKTFLK